MAVGAHLTRLGTVAVVGVLVAGACGGTAPAPTGPGAAPPSGSGATVAPTAGPSVTLPPFDLAALTKAAQAEVDLVRAMRDDLGVASAIGADGAAVLAAIDSADGRFGERVVAELGQALGIELGPAAGVQLASLERGSFAATSITSGSLTSTISNYLAIGTQLLEKADQTQTFPYEKKESSTQTVGTVTTSETASLTITGATGGGQMTFDVEIATSTQFLRDGILIGLLNRIGKGRIELNGCPRASGEAPGKVDVKVGELWSAGGRTWTADQAVSGSLLITADDTAKLASATANIATSGGGTDGAGGTWNASGTASFGTGTAPTVTSSGATQAQVDRTTGAGVLVLFILGGVSSEAEKFWRSGKCIELKSSRESGDVKPKEEIKLSIDAIHRFDSGVHVAGPIKATFSGTKSLEPANTPQDAPGSYTFTAGEKKDDTGTIQLEQTSRRGIGKKTLTFKVGVTDYRIVGTPTGVGLLSGTKCKGLPGAWVVTISGPGTKGTSTFTLPEGGGSAPAHTIVDITVADVKSHLDLNGTASVELPSGGSPAPPPILHLVFGTGTQKVTSPNGSTTISTNGGSTDVPLEVGKFCQ